MTNQVLETMMNHKSIRKYKKEMPTDELINAIVQAGQQAPFASQLYSILFTRKGNIPFGAPLLFTVCVDIHKLGMIMKKRGWDVATNDVSLLLFGIEDAMLAAENMVIAGASCGLGSCFLGAAPYMAEKIKREYKLPDKVFPIVQLVMGYPDEAAKPRPRYPMEFTLFEDQYPELSDDMLQQAMKQMDEGYVSQEYYRKLNAKITLEDGKKETYDFDSYGWTEHISRKWGQWHKAPKLMLEPLKKCGFDLGDKEEQ